MKNSLRGLGLMIALLAVTAPAFAQRMQTERFRNRDVVSQEIIVRFRGSESAASRSQTIRREDSDITATDVVGRSGAVRLRSRGRNVAALIQAYSRRSDVEYAEPNYVWKASDLPNDSFFNDQWALQNTGQVVGQAGAAGADIKATLAWDVAEGSRGIVVGMIDTGIDYTHPDLIDNIWTAPSAFSVTIGGQTIQCAAGTHGFNAITRTCDPMDDDGHGTHTAGIVGASGNNAVAVTGVSRVANLMGLKFLNSAGVGTTVNAIAAIEFAIQVKQAFPTAANIRVLNGSWGGTDFSQALLDEINLAGANDMLFVAAAGNSGMNIDLVPEYPAAYSAANLISVAATDNRDQYASFTNWGSGHVHLAAPGVEIMSTMRGKFYGRQSGTSSAAAVVSGAAALVLSACGLNTAALKSNILTTVDAIPSNPGDTATEGRLNVNTAVRSCAGALPASFTVSISPGGRTIDFGLSDQFALNIAALNGFSSTVNFAATNLPAGMTASFTPNGTQTSTATLSIDIAPNTAQGTYFVGITATGGGVTRAVGILVTAGVPTSCTIDPGIGFAAGSLDTIDAASIHRPPAYADYCSFTLATDRAIEIEMRGSIDSYLYLLSSSGSVVASDDNGGNSGANSLVSAELFAGTYTIEATTAVPAQTGSYTLQLRSRPPEVTAITPDFGTQGTSVAITITGSVFFGQPITVKVFNCTGTTVSDTQVVNPTTVTATLNLANQTGTCTVGVSSAGGESRNTRAFRILPPTPVITGITPDSGLQGQIVPITITGTNLLSGQVPTPGFGMSFIVKSVTANEIKGNLHLLVGTSPGAYNLTVSNISGVSNAATFTVILAPPTFVTFAPSPAGGPGRSVDLHLVGTSFVGVVEVLTGEPGITVTNLVVRHSGALDARFNVASDVPYGDYPVRISTDAGISGAQVFKVVPPPTISSPTPNRVFLGRTTNVTLTGTNLYCNRGITISGTGVHFGVGSGSGDGCGSLTTFPFFLTVDGNAAVGTRTLTLTAPNGVSNSVTIDVQTVPAVIQTVTPAYGAIGTTTNVTIIGTDLTAGIVNISGSGVAATPISSTSTILTASIAIEPTAAIGARALTVTPPNGISDPVTFYVTPTTWPDLTVSQTIPPLLAIGYDEIYSITISNVGTKETTAPITVVDTVKSGDQFVSVSAGWTCTQAAELVTCTTSQSIARNAQVTFQLTVRINGTFNHSNTVEVSSPEDYNIPNNKSTAFALDVSKPTPNISIQSAQPGQQGKVSITLPSAFPREIIDPMNVVTMTFTPAIAGMPGDPASQFATGGTTVPFTFKANTLSADFPGISGPVGFQLGTVAGTLTFTMRFRATNGTIMTRTATATIASAAPTIREIVPVKTSSGFEAGITLLTSTREIRNISFQFNTPTPIKLSCGGASGCTATGTFLGFNVNSIFNTWFASSSAYGGVAIVRVPFTISQGTLAGTITVTLTNTLGNSNSMTFPIP